MLARSSECPPWSVERPLQGLEQTGDVTHYHLGTVGAEAGAERGERAGPRDPPGKCSAAGGRGGGRGERRAGPSWAGLRAPRAGVSRTAAGIVGASLLPLSGFHTGDLCKTGSAPVTMALLVAEKCASQHSESHWPLAP